MSKHPLERLSPEDQEFALRFLLASGSLKEVAQSYGVSYPTLRGRLNRLITRLEELRAGRQPDPMAELLATMVERGQVGTKDAHRLLKVHRDQLKQPDNSDD